VVKGWAAWAAVYPHSVTWDPGPGVQLASCASGFGFFDGIFTHGPG
jgi:hypothetical protein